LVKFVEENSSEKKFLARSVPWKQNSLVGDSLEKKFLTRKIPCLKIPWKKNPRKKNSLEKKILAWRFLGK
jgi:hypothetical protein